MSEDEVAILLMFSVSRDISDSKLSTFDFIYF